MCIKQEKFTADYMYLMLRGFTININLQSKYSCDFFLCEFKYGKSILKFITNIKGNI